MNILNKKELNMMVETISNTNGFSHQEVIDILQEVFSVSLRKKVGKGSVVNVNIDDKYNVDVFREYMVIDDNHSQLADGEEYDADYHIYDDQVEEIFGNVKFKYGDVLQLPIEDISIDRHVTNIAKQQLKVKINEFNKNLIKKEFSSKKNELLPFIVKSYNKAGYVVELLNGHIGKIPYTNLFRMSEKLMVGSRYFGMLDLEDNNNNLVLTRKGDAFVKMLFAREVDDVFNEIVNIDAVCTINGVKTVVAVSSNDKNIDPVGTCIGSRGVRVNAISDHLSNENLEIINWNPDFTSFVDEYLDSVVEKIVISDTKIDLVLKDGVDEDTAFGNKGYKKDVLAKFYRKEINVHNDEEFNDDSDFIVTYFENELGLDADSAKLLVNSGLTNIDDIGLSTVENLMDLVGLDVDSANYLMNVSRDSINDRKERIALSKTNLSELETIDDYIIDQLLANGVKTIEELSDLDSFEFVEMIPVVDTDYAGQVIMEARK